MIFLAWEIPVAFPRESQVRQGRATQPTVHARCFSVSIIHRTLTWTTGCLTCIYVNACDCTGGCTDTKEEFELKVDSGSKIPCLTGESNLRQRRAHTMLYQLSYIPTLLHPHSDLLCKLHTTFCLQRIGKVMLNEPKRQKLKTQTLLAAGEACKADPVQALKRKPLLPLASLRTGSHFQHLLYPRCRNPTRSNKVDRE